MLLRTCTRVLEVRKWSFNLPVSTVELFPLCSNEQPLNPMQTVLQRGVWELVLVSPAADTFEILEMTTRILQYYW